MNARQTRLLIPTGGPPLDPAQMAALAACFDVVTGAAADEALAAGVSESDMVLHPGTSVAAELDAIEAAGQAMLSLKRKDLETMNAVQRIEWLKQRVHAAVHDLMHFDHFEVRLTNPRTSQLELVLAVGIKPLGIGKFLYARPEHNGISGYVAYHGRPYMCNDVTAEPLYTEGLEMAGSELCVPLRLHGEVIGVLNIEAHARNAFSDRDLLAAERLAKYIAIELYVLDLLVAERFTTRQATARSFAEEMQGPLEVIRNGIDQLRTSSDLPETMLGTVAELADGLRRTEEAISRCRVGPKSLLGAESTLRSALIHPSLKDKRILVVDDDAAFRDQICTVLRQSGADVLVCADGSSALESLSEAARDSETLDLVLSDVRLPDYNGFEVYQAARERFVNVPVILMTGFGYDPHHSIVRASQEGLQSILFKPFKADQLIEECVRAVGTT
ncbi:MAG: response regulator [Phycisphaerales bacterium]